MNHDYGQFEWCKRCGASRMAVLDHVRPQECISGDNVVAISELLAVRWYNRELAPVTGNFLRETE